MMYGILAENIGAPVKKLKPNPKPSATVSVPKPQDQIQDKANFELSFDSDGQNIDRLDLSAHGTTQS